MPTNVVYDGTELRFVANGDNINSGTRFYVDAYNDQPTLDTGTVHADSVVAKQFASISSTDSDNSNAPISGALGIVNALSVMHSESKRYSIDRASLEACVALQPHLSRVIIKQREVTCFVFTQLMPIMLSAIQELDKKVDALAKLKVQAKCPHPHHHHPHPHCDSSLSHILSLLQLSASDASGAHCGDAPHHASLMRGIARLITEQETYITFLTRLLEVTPERPNNLVVGCFYVHRTSACVPRFACDG
jgi:hypothetical protein